MLKRLGGLLAAAALVGGIGVAEAGPAAADPGFCGVRHAGPDQGVDLWMIYTVHNKCGYWINVQVVVQGQATPCGQVAPYDNGHFLSYRSSNDWYVKAC